MERNPMFFQENDKNITMTDHLYLKCWSGSQKLIQRDNMHHLQHGSEVTTPDIGYMI